MNTNKNTEYNGWKNRETWNVALWINNTEQLYDAAKWHMLTHKGASYNSFIFTHALRDTKTGDGVSYSSPLLDHAELNAMMKEIADE